MAAVTFPAKTIERLTLYHCILSQALGCGKNYISSAQIAKTLKINDTQVRKDIASCAITGKAKKGYEINTLKNAIEQSLGFTQRKKVFIIGAGNLGFALAQYEGFKNYGIDILALFDIAPQKVGKTVNEKQIFSMDFLPEAIKKFEVQTVILTVPAKQAQEVANYLIKAGISYIWNFTPCVLDVPKNISVHYENLMGSFLKLKNSL